MPLPERYRCCRKSLPVTEDFLSLLESAAGQNPALFFPVRRKGSEESVKAWFHLWSLLLSDSLYAAGHGIFSMAARFLFRSLHGTNSSMKAEMRQSGAPCPVLKNFKPIGFL